LAKTILELCGTKSAPVHTSSRPGEVKRLCADITKARQLLGFEPEYTIKKGLNEFT